jgi:glutathione S-transferase
MDSHRIATALEDAFPTPSLHLESEYLPQMNELVWECQRFLTPFWMPAVPRHILNPVSAEYFNRTRKERIGKPLEEMAKEATAEQWEKSRPAFEKIAALLKTNGGPFIMGDTGKYQTPALSEHSFTGDIVSYADFVLVSFLHFLKRTDEEAFTKSLAVDDALKNVYDASSRWLERDSY